MSKWIGLVSDEFSIAIAIFNSRQPEIRRRNANFTIEKGKKQAIQIKDGR